MIKNRINQIIFQTVYCVLAFIGILDSFGYFSKNFNVNFYLYYTNISNYICAIFMLFILIKTIRESHKNIYGFCNVMPLFNFMCIILIMITFLVYNIILVNMSFIDYFTSMSNVIMHFILPIMFILNWLLFYEHGKTKWYYPLLSFVIPILYLMFIFIRAMILGIDSGKFLFPYFFLDINWLGLIGVFCWVISLLISFTIIGYLIYFLDNIKRFKNL